MKRIYYILFVITIASVSLKCQKEISRNNTIPLLQTAQPSPITATVQGNVLAENSQPAANVKVSVGAKNATTDAHGYFRITDASLDEYASLVTAEQPGYFKAYRTFSATSGVNQVVIMLTRKTMAGTINAATGGDITLSNGTKISLPANSVSKASGGVYSGNINVYAAYIDPTSNNIGKVVPGSFMADDKDERRVVLSSFGMLAVEIESTSAEKLQITAGSAATLVATIPAPVLSSAPAGISLWHLDEQTGLWQEEGTAKKNGNAYVGQVKHFSYWNYDYSSPGVGFSATFKTADGMPVTNAGVGVRAVVDNNGYAQGYTDSLGQVSGLIPADTKLVLEVFDQCGNVVFTKNIGPFSKNTDLGTIPIPGATSSLVTIKGKLLNCNNNAVSHGYTTIYFNNFVYNAGVNAKGEFSANIFSCAGNPQSVDVLGTDEDAQQQGTLQTIPLTPQTTNIGGINACGTSSLQYINYTLDGNDHALSNSGNDSLVAYSFPAGALFTTHIQGFDSPGNLLHFDFTGKATAGSYPVNSLVVANYDDITLDKPFNVTITAFPKNPGEFYEGSFSGSFTDSSDKPITHHINCSFRIKMY